MRYVFNICHVVILLAFSSIALVLIIIEYDGISKSSSRRLAEIFIPPLRGVANDYTGPFLHHIQHTTSQQTRDDVLKTLISQDPERYKDIGSNTTALIDAVNRYFAANRMKYEDNPHELIHSLFSNHDNNPHVDDVANKHSSHHHKKWYYEFEGRRIQDMFDIVFVLECHIINQHHPITLQAFFQAWQPIIQDIHMVIIQPGEDCDVDHTIHKLPSWLDYDLFTSYDIITSLHDFAFIFDLTSSSSSSGIISSAQVFGTLVADHDFIYYLDRDTMPCYDNHHTLINPLEEHLSNLLAPATPYYYNSNYDAYKLGSDFTAGYPYSLRGGVPTAISIGHVASHIHTDTITPKVAAMKHDDIIYDANHHPVVSVPYGVLYSLSMTNLAVNRLIAGPTLYLATIMQSKIPLGDRNAAIIAGWIGKNALDHVYAGVKHGGKTHVQYHQKNDTLDSIALGLQEDLIWNAIGEKLVRYLSVYTIRERTHDSSVSAMREVLSYLSSEPTSSDISPHIISIIHAYESYLNLWDKMAGFYPSYAPVASYSSKAPDPSAKHQCVAFTIFHKEPYFLPVWLRYYSKHFPNAVYLLHHHRNDSEPPPQLPTNDPGSSDMIYGNYSYIELYGEAHGFSVMWVAHMVSTYQQRFLRSGYKCVLFSDIDEYIVPDHDIYPNGLSDYMMTFQHDAARTYIRGLGYEVCHISDLSYEGEMIWNASVLMQRHYWNRHSRYDKPLISKALIRYKAGQHTAFLPSFIPHDDHLALLHAAYMDRDYCMIREKYKYETALQMPIDDRNKGFNAHIFEYPSLLQAGKLCKLARGSYDNATGKAYDGAFKALEKIPAHFAKAVI